MKNGLLFIFLAQLELLIFGFLFWFLESGLDCFWKLFLLWGLFVFFILYLLKLGVRRGIKSFDTDTLSLE